jgi:hypothetical protein
MAISTSSSQVGMGEAAGDGISEEFTPDWAAVLLKKNSEPFEVVLGTVPLA